MVRDVFRADAGERLREDVKVFISLLESRLKIIFKAPQLIRTAMEYEDDDGL